MTTVPDGWECLATGAVALVTPSSGAHSTRVNVAGTNPLGGGSSLVSITLGDIAPESVTPATSDSIQVVVDASGNGVGAGDIRIVSNTGAHVVGASTWTCVTPASIDSVAPARGAIPGNGLLAGGAEIISVTLANVAVGVLGASSDTRVDVVAGAGSDRTGNVVMVADSGAIISLEDGWECTTTGVFTSMTPAVGQHGTVVTIAGTDLLAGGTGHTEISLQMKRSRAPKVQNQSFFESSRAQVGDRDGTARSAGRPPRRPRQRLGACCPCGAVGLDCDSQPVLRGLWAGERRSSPGKFDKRTFS